jgi:hypothetical protein
MAVKSLIETVTVGAGGAASIEFTDIPQDGGDLVCVISTRVTGYDAPGNVGIILDGDTTNANYSSLFLRATITSISNNVQSFSGSYRPYFPIPGDTATTSTFGNTSVYISNYTSSLDKSISIEMLTETNESAGQGAEWQGGLVASKHSTNSSTDSLLLSSLNGNFVQYSTASLYKIKYD